MYDDQNSTGCSFYPLWFTAVSRCTLHVVLINSENENFL